MESRLEEIFSMGISCMSLAVWLVEDRKCSAAVVGLDLVLARTQLFTNVIISLVARSCRPELTYFEGEEA